MSSYTFSSFSTLFITILLFLLSLPSAVLSDDEQNYIIAVQRPPIAIAASTDELKDYYASFLPKSSPSLFSNRSRLSYAFKYAFSGFATRLTPEELEEVSRKEGFLHAYPDRTIQLLTTRTQAFLGLNSGNGLWWRGGGDLGEGIVIGMMDSGFTPGHPSFDDAGVPPPPPSWKGTCEKNVCNNKVIGARSLRSGPIDVDTSGHGTHTASTAAGAFVHGANLLGQANGTASGMAPRAHLAIYKVCAINYCNTSDVVAAIDLAIEDGVDIISISLGGLQALPFYDDLLAIGTLAAVEKGVVVSLAGGNGGPDPSSLTNEAPWMLTVAASTFDRSIRATVRLSHGLELTGESLYQPTHFRKDQLPLVSKDCASRKLTDVNGTVVLCHRQSIGMLRRLRSLGAIAVIIMNYKSFGETILDELDIDLPTVLVSYKAGMVILHYVNHTTATDGSPAVSIRFEGTILDVRPAPVVGCFSSRGPSRVNPHVMKPDISGPGVNVLAACPHVPLPTGAFQATAPFKIESGTSMSTPHLAGIAALLKKAHPGWSPAAIKSAIMTTSNVTGNDGRSIQTEKLQPAGFHDMGSGHVNPELAADPGLVYDVHPDEYIQFLCGLAYTDKQVSIIARRDIACDSAGRIQQSELNYPSISLFLPPGSSSDVTRTVTNVGPAKGTYFAVVDELPGVLVEVKPRMLKFSKVNEKKRFTVRFERDGGEESWAFVEGNLRWVSGKYVVRSPLHVDLNG